MAIEVKVPMLPESIADATISTWHKKAGDAVSRDENLMDLETDKVMLEVPSPVDGILKEIIKKTGDTVKANEVVAVVEENAAGAKPAKAATDTAKTAAPAASKTETAKAAPAQPAATSSAALSPAVRSTVAEH